MPSLYPYRIFISYAWRYNDEYYKLEKLFKECPNFDFRNYSVPEHDPFDSSEKLTKKLLDQMNPSHVIIVLAGMYVNHSDWIQYEINEAVRLKKPIIGVKPWNQQKVPEAVQKVAVVMHGWNVVLLLSPFATWRNTDAQYVVQPENIGMLRIPVFSGQLKRFP